MTPEQLAEIKARCEAATEGPWEIYVPKQSNGWARLVPSGDREHDIMTCYSCVYPLDMDKNNADFIAHARQDIPALLEYIATLSEEVAKLTARAEKAEKQDGGGDEK